MQQHRDRFKRALKEPGDPPPLLLSAQPPPHTHTPLFSPAPSTLGQRLLPASPPRCWQTRLMWPTAVLGRSRVGGAGCMAALGLQVSGRDGTCGLIPLLEDLTGGQVDRGAFHSCASGRPLPLPPVAGPLGFLIPPPPTPVQTYFVHRLRPQGSAPCFLRVPGQAPAQHAPLAVAPSLLASRLLSPRTGQHKAFWKRSGRCPPHARLSCCGAGDARRSHRLGGLASGLTAGQGLLCRLFIEASDQAPPSLGVTDRVGMWEAGFSGGRLSGRPPQGAARRSDASGRPGSEPQPSTWVCEWLALGRPVDK